MLTIIFCWLVLGIVIYLIGRLVVNERFLKFLQIKEFFEWYEYFWIGLAAVFAILQIWSIFLPVNIYSLFFVFFLAGISFFVLIKKRIKIPKLNFKFLACAGFILFAISYFASLSGGWPDTYGYHLQIVEWTGLSKIVPGLANLYTRLGFNSSFFLFASMINNLFLKDRTSHVALSLLTSVLVFEYIFVFIRTKNNYLKIFVLLTSPIVIEGIAHSVQVSSLSYDYALLITVLAICVELIKNDKKSLIIASVLSMLLVTIKLSGAVFSLIAICFALIKILKEESKKVRLFIFTVLSGLLLIIPYIVRNVILSGWPLYPLPILGLNLPWTMPRSRVVDLVNVIKGWAISPGSQWHNAVNLSFFQWFPVWFLGNSGRIELIIFIFAVALLVVLLLMKKINKELVGKNLGLLACIVASFASVLYLLIFAPDLRFGGVYFWIFFAAVSSVFLVGFLGNSNRLITFVIVVSLFLVIYVSRMPRLDGAVILRSIRWDQPGDTYNVLITPVDNSPSFYVSTPTDTSSCGNVQLPCTSEPFDIFKEMVPGNIFGGFAPVR